MMKPIYLAFLPVSLMLLAVSCTHEPFDPVIPEVQLPDGPCDPDSVYFQDDILPILTSNCAFSGCHDQGTATEGVRLNSYANLMQSDVIEPGDPDDSELYERITDDDPSDRMPLAPNNPLTADQIQLIRDWISQGAQDNACSAPIEGCNTDNVTFSGDVWNIISNKCQGCHSGTAPGGGIALDTHADVAGIAMDGRLEGVIQHLDGYKAMPLGGPQLPQCDIEAIGQWIADGTPDN